MTTIRLIATGALAVERCPALVSAAAGGSGAIVSTLLERCS